MLRQQSERWWAVTLNGVVALIVGVVTLLWPGITLGALIVIFGIFTLADGVLGLGALLFGARRVGPWWLRLLGSLLSIAAGLIALLWPGITSLALLWLVAAWALAKGILQIVIAVRYREHLARTWLLVLAGAVSLILGIVYVLFPGGGDPLARVVAWHLRHRLRRGAHRPRPPATRRQPGFQGRGKGRHLGGKPTSARPRRCLTSRHHPTGR